MDSEDMASGDKGQSEDDKIGEGRANAGSIGSNSSTRRIERIERIEPRICTSVEPHRCIVSPASLGALYSSAKL